MYTIFHLGSPTNNITIESYDKFRNHPAVKWTIPISLGDSYRQFRVVATNQSFFDHYQFHGDKKITFSKGHSNQDVFDVVLGKGVANKLSHQIGDEVILSHGVMNKNLLSHEKLPFKVVGILNATGTPVDNTVIINLQGMEAIHVGWENGYPMKNSQKINYKEFELRTSQITSFILRSKSRIALLSLQRQIADHKNEALSAIIPALTLGQLWSLLDKVELSLLIVSFFVVLVGFISLLIVLYMSVNERTKEMKILRSIGASAKDIFLLLMVETLLLTFLGVFFGILFHYFMLLSCRSLVMDMYGIFLNISYPQRNEMLVMLMFIFFGGIFGVVPALKAYSATSKLRSIFK